MRIPPPSPPFVGPSPNVWHDDHGRPVHNSPEGGVIVIHGTAGTCAPGQARAVARAFNVPGAKKSAHYIVDPAETVQDVADHQVAEHCGLNLNMLGIEHALELPSQEWDMRHAGRYADDNHQRMLRRGYRLTARLCLAYGIPIRRLTAGQLTAWHQGKGAGGIVGHDTVSKAFPNLTTHWDPGPAFPWEDYMAGVQRFALYLQRKERAGK